MTEPSQWKVTTDGENAIEAALAILHSLKDAKGERVTEVIIHGESDRGT